MRRKISGRLSNSQESFWTKVLLKKVKKLGCPRETQLLLSLRRLELYLNKYHFAFERRKGNYYNQTNNVFYCKIWHFGLKMTFLHQIF